MGVPPILGLANQPPPKKAPPPKPAVGTPEWWAGLGAAGQSIWKSTHPGFKTPAGPSASSGSLGAPGRTLQSPQFKAWVAAHPGETVAENQLSFSRLPTSVQSSFGKPKPKPAPGAPPAPPPTPAGDTSAAAPSPSVPSSPDAMPLMNPGIVDSNVIHSLVSAPPPDFQQSVGAMQKAYQPALDTLNRMQSAAQNVRDMRNADINTFQNFVNNQATAAQQNLATVQQSYVGASNDAQSNIAAGLQGAQGLIGSNQALAGQSGLGDATAAAQATAGAAQAGAKNVVNAAQANSAGMADQTKFAADIASQERTAAQNAQTNLEVNTFLPKMLEIEQGIPGAAAQLYAQELQRQIEAGKIDMAGQIATGRDLTQQTVAQTRAASANNVAQIRSQTAIYNQAAKDATSNQDAFIRAYASQNVATIKARGSGQNSFLSQLGKGPGGANSSWMTFNQYPPDQQASMINSQVIRGKQLGLPFKDIMSSIYANDPYYASNAVYSTPQYQQQWLASYKRGK